MQSSCRKIVVTCELCQKAKISPYLHGPMQSIIPEGVNQIMCLDLIGPLPPARGGMTQLLVCVDAFSKLVTLFPLRRATTAAILKRVINDYFKRAGKPKIILSDNGTQFASKKWQHNLEAEGVKVHHTSVYYPQGNPTERVKREIGRILRSVCHEKHTKWASVIPQVEKWLNRAIHSGTRFSPNYLHFGKREPVGWFSELGFPPDGHPTPAHEQIVEIAYKNLLTKAEKRQQKHDNQHKLVTFVVGDKVLVRTHPQSSAEERQIKKLFLLFTGPARVIAIRGPNSYELVDEKTGANLGIHNVRNLRPYVQM
nr:unnamed protein product [Callosobruchus analis]